MFTVSTLIVVEQLLSVYSIYNRQLIYMYVFCYFFPQLLELCPGSLHLLQRRAFLVGGVVNVVEVVLRVGAMDVEGMMGVGEIGGAG